MATALSTFPVEEEENGSVRSDLIISTSGNDVDPSPPPVNPTDAWFNWLPSWKPTSEESLLQTEKAILDGLTSEYTDHYVQVSENTYIRTLTMAPVNATPTDNERYPLVMVHGFGCGLCCFYKNFDHLHSKRRLYAFDVLGFARSTRAPFSNEPDLVENEFVESIEKWRKAMRIEKMILLGHSLGAFMCTAYAMKHPERVRHLILNDAWGFPEQPVEVSSSRYRSRRYRFMTPVFRAYSKVFNPFAMIRALGPMGPRVVSRFRSDLQDKFGEDFMSYVYHCNAQMPTGETAFFYMQSNIAYAKRPMLNRLDDLPSSLPMSLLHGMRSWFDTSTGEKVYLQRPNSFVDVHYIEEAGHHIHADLPDIFNQVVNEICEMVDSNGDAVSAGERRDEQIAFHTHQLN